MALRFGLFILLMVSGALSAGAASPFEMWHGRSPTPTLCRLNSVAYGNGRFIAVGEFGTVLVSTNGADWSQVPCPTTNRLINVIFARDRFIIGGAAGTILSSQDGLNWTDGSLAIPQDVTAIGFGQGSNVLNGLFVAFASRNSLGAFGGPDTILLSSSDGIVWTHIPTSGDSVSGERFDSITFGKERFIASVPIFGIVSDYFHTMISSRGTNWTDIGGDLQGPITFGNGLFVNSLFFDVRQTGTRMVAYTSPDGYSWTGGDPNGSPRFSLGLCFGGGRFVAVGQNGYTGNSPDGTNWTVATASTDGALRSVIYGGGLYVAVGDTGAIFSSPDGNSWSRRSSGPGRHLYAAAPDRDGFVVSGEAGTLAVSSNGVVWKEVSAPTTNSLYAALSINGQCILAGINGTILSGESFSNLLARDSGTTQGLFGAAFGAESYVAVGAGGTVVRSTNSTDWSVELSGATNDLTDVVFGNGKFVAVGAEGIVLSSSNAMNWRKEESRASGYLSDIAFGNDRFVAVKYTAGWESATSNVVVSKDGITWSNIDGLYPAAIGYGAGFFLMPDARGPLLNVSRDGFIWSSYVIPSNSPALFDVTYNNGTFLSTGLNGKIVQSDPIVSLGVSFDGLAHVAIEGPKDRTYRIEANDKVVGSNGWTAVTTLLAPPYSWSDPESVSKSNRFYRAVLVE